MGHLLRPRYPSFRGIRPIRPPLTRAVGASPFPSTHRDGCLRFSPEQRGVIKPYAMLELQKSGNAADKETVKRFSE
jgi:hypothetical protein